MTLDEKLLNMLSSNDPQVRYMALEQIQNSTTSSEKIVSALEKATHDEDKGTALRARVALQSDVHHQTANQMGIIVPEVNEEESQFILDQTTAKLPPGERPKLAFVGKTADEIPMPITVPWVLQISQAIAFVICVFGLIRYLLFPTGFRLSDYWILIPFFIFGGLEVYVSREYGFKESFQFLGLIVRYLFHPRYRQGHRHSSFDKLNDD